MISIFLTYILDLRVSDGWERGNWGGWAMERKLRGRESVGGWELIGIVIWVFGRRMRWQWLESKELEPRDIQRFERETNPGALKSLRERMPVLTKKKIFYLFLGQIKNTTKFIVFGQISTKFYLYFFLNYSSLNQNSSVFYYLETRIILVFQLFVFFFLFLIH